MRAAVEGIGDISALIRFELAGTENERDGSRCIASEVAEPPGEKLLLTTLA